MTAEAQGANDTRLDRIALRSGKPSHIELADSWVRSHLQPIFAIIVQIANWFQFGVNVDLRSHPLLKTVDLLGSHDGDVDANIVEIDANVRSAIVQMQRKTVPVRNLA